MPIADHMMAKRLLIALAAACAIFIFYLAGIYFAYPGYLDHGEGTNTLIAWRLLNGEQVYPSFDQPVRVTNVYGPLTYILSAAVMGLAGSTLATGKIVPLVALAVTPLVVFLGQRSRGIATAAAATVLMTGFILLNTPIPMLGRPDSALVLLVALGVWVARGGDASNARDSYWRAAAIAGLAGAAVNLKVYGAVFFVPIALSFLADRSWRLLPIMAVAGAGAVLLPFAFPSISLPGYLSWFVVLSGKAGDLAALPRVSRFAVFYLVPIVLYLLVVLERPADGPASPRPREWPAVAGYLFSFCVILLAIKPGAGHHYLYPCAPVAVDMMMRYVPRGVGRRLAAKIIVALTAAVMLTISIPMLKRFHRALHWDEARAIRQELKAIMADYPGRTIEMGIGQDVVSYKRAFSKTDLVLAGNPYTFDHAIMIELSFLGYPLPDSTLAMIRGCSTDIWLIPKGDSPFDLFGYYGNTVFSDEFRAAFLGSYERRATRRYYDIWECRRSG